MRVKFKQWLVAIGGETYLESFISSGYDLEFVSKVYGC